MAYIIRGALCAAAFAGVLACPSIPALSEELNVTVHPRRASTAPTISQAVEAMRDIPGGADVIPATQFQEGYALSMKDMLAGSPGVFVQPRWGEESRLSIRGSGLSRSFHLRGIMLLQDGIPFNFADGSGDFQEIDPLVLQHVEVYRGGQALRYGAANLGGAVNMVTPTAYTAKQEALLRFEAGSFDTRRAHAQASKIFKNVDVFAAATKSVSDGYRQQSDQDNTRFSGNLGVKINPAAETRFYVAWNDINQEVPGTISKEDALHNPKSVPAINLSNDYARDVRSLRVANRTVFMLDNGMDLEVGAYANDKSLYHPIFQVIDQESLDLGAFARLKGGWTVSDLNNDFTIGMNAGHGVNDAKRYVNTGGKRGALTADAEQVARNVEIYGENRLHFAPDWSFILGMQGNIAARDYSDHLNAANDDDKIFRSLNPKIGVLWKAGPGAEIYASVTRSSEVPTFSELVQGAVPGFVPVKLQKAWTAEIGSRGREGKFFWDATLYYARVQDEMLQFTTSADIPASTFNADDTIHQGAEIGVGWQATEELSFHAIYNYNDFRFDDDAQYGDNRLAGAPRHQVRLSARYEDHGFHVEPNMEIVPEAAPVDYANTMKADSYAVAGINAGWDVTENVTLFLDAKNLTDKRYISSFSTVTDTRTAATNVFYPGDGRSVFAGMKVRF
jgi:iron complex outermembrane receptor protein